MYTYIYARIYANCRKDVWTPLLLELWKGIDVGAALRWRSPPPLPWDPLSYTSVV